MGIEASVPWRELGLEIAASVPDGERAAECCGTLAPDILLTDIRMPGLDGLGLLRRIREKDTRMRVIIITNVEDFGVLHSAVALGITAYLLKSSMTPQDLRDALLRALDELGETRADAQELPREEAGAVLYAAFPADTDPARQRAASAALLEKLSTLGFWSALTHGRRTEFRLSMPADVPDFARVRNVLADTLREQPSSLLYHIYDGSVRKLAALPQRVSMLLTDPYFTAGTMLFLDADFRCHSPAVHARLARLETEPAYTGYRTGPRRERAVAHLAEAGQSFAVSRSGFEAALLAFAAAVFGPEGFLPAPDVLSRLEAELPAAAGAEEATALLEAAYPRFSRHPVYGPAIEETVQYIREHLTSTLLVPALAKQASLSPNYYARLFKSAVGLSVTEFIARLRLERACDLLLEDRLSIQEIARACGFADVPYFSRFFRQYTGLPPRRWKNRRESAQPA